VNWRLEVRRTAVGVELAIISREYSCARGQLRMMV